MYDPVDDQGQRRDADDRHRRAVLRRGRRPREARRARARAARPSGPSRRSSSCARRSAWTGSARRLGDRGVRVKALHGDMSQGQRDGVMLAFKGGRERLLVATDVAARGLDISGVTHVVNYDMPNSPDVYVHRIGRTGRVGARGPRDHADHARSSAASSRRSSATRRPRSSEWARTASRPQAARARPRRPSARRARPRHTKPHPRDGVPVREAVVARRPARRGSSRRTSSSASSTTASRERRRPQRRACSSASASSRCPPSARARGRSVPGKRSGDMSSRRRSRSDDEHGRPCTPTTATSSRAVRRGRAEDRRQLPEARRRRLLRRRDLPPRDQGLHDPGRRPDGHRHAAARATRSRTSSTSTRSCAARSRWRTPARTRTAASSSSSRPTRRRGSTASTPSSAAWSTGMDAVDTIEGTETGHERPPVSRTRSSRGRAAGISSTHRPSPIRVTRWSPNS